MRRACSTSATAIACAGRCRATRPRRRRWCCTAARDRALRPALGGSSSPAAGGWCCSTSAGAAAACRTPPSRARTCRPTRRRTSLGDIERLRRHLGVERWLVLGGSWGSTLALAYAEQHPERVTALVLHAVATTTPAEIAWITRGVGAFLPEAFARFEAGVPESGARRPGRRLSPPADAPRSGGACAGGGGLVRLGAGGGGAARPPAAAALGRSPLSPRLRAARHPLFPPRRLARGRGAAARGGAAGGRPGGADPRPARPRDAARHRLAAGARLAGERARGARGRRATTAATRAWPRRSRGRSRASREFAADAAYRPAAAREFRCRTHAQPMHNAYAWL